MFHSNFRHQMPCTAYRCELKEIISRVRSNGRFSWHVPVERERKEVFSFVRSGRMASSKRKREEEASALSLNTEEDCFPPDPTSPLWLTYKYRVDRLSTSTNVYDFQLRTHFLHSGNLYALRCSCPNHKHNKTRCTISDDRECSKCGTPTALLVTYQSLLFHGPSLQTHNAYACCLHEHRPPCERCTNCRSFNIGEDGRRQRLPCSVTDTVECNLITGEYALCFRCFVVAWQRERWK